MDDMPPSMSKRMNDGALSVRAARYGRLLFALWAAAVVVLSLLPQEALPPTFGIGDLVQHGAVYAAGGICAAVGWRAWRGLAPALAAGAALGALLELAQHEWVPGRFGEWADAGANAAGLLLGAIAFRLFTAWRRRRGGYSKNDPDNFTGL
jgi:VanZ family protein